MFRQGFAKLGVARMNFQRAFLPPLPNCLESIIGNSLFP
jgi:hypothetical protein